MTSTKTLVAVLTATHADLQTCLSDRKRKTIPMPKSETEVSNVWMNSVGFRIRAKASAYPRGHNVAADCEPVELRNAREGPNTSRFSNDVGIKMSYE